MRTLTITIALALVASTAHADVTAAARAFSEGQQAQLAGDYDRAAQDYELAYSIQPSKEALRSAIRARMLGGQLARAATLAEMLQASYGDDPPSAKLAKDVLGDARAKLGHVTLTCSAPCTIAVDGRAVSIAPTTQQTFFVAQGKHELEATFGDQSVKHAFMATAGEDAELELTKPAPKVEPVKPLEHVDTPPPPVKPLVRRAEPAPPRGVPRIVPLAGAGLTVVLGGLAIWSGVDTLHAHDAYVKNPSDAAYDDGRSKQLRTNILFGVTGAAAIGTGLVAVFWTRWHDAPSTEPAIGTTANGGVTLGVTGRF